MTACHAIPGSSLTPDEVAALQAVADGATVAEVAQREHWSAATVKERLRAAYRRLGASNRPNAVFLAMKAGVIR